MIPSSMGIDTWDIDFVLLGHNIEVLGVTVAYRDWRTIGMDTKISQLTGWDRACALAETG